MVEDSWVMLDLESEITSQGLHRENCKKSPWTGQNWSKYPGETASSYNVYHQQGDGEEEKLAVEYV